MPLLQCLKALIDLAETSELLDITLLLLIPRAPCVDLGKPMNASEYPLWTWM
jgi:hypothetical protein